MKYFLWLELEQFKVRKSKWSKMTTSCQAKRGAKTYASTKRADRPMLVRFSKKWIMTDVGRLAVAQLRYFETRFPASNNTY